MKEFIVDFFKSYGSRVKEQDHVLRIDLSPELTTYFQRPTLQLVFNSQYLSPETELVTHGSYIFNLIYDLLKDRGVKTFLKLPRRVSSLERGRRGSTTPKASLEDIQFCNGELIHKRTQRTYQVDWYFNFKITYWFDEKIEETYALKVNSQGILTRCPDPFSELCWMQGELNGQKSRPPLSRDKIRRLYERCLAEVQAYAREQSTKLQEKLMERLYKNLSRLEVYYRQSQDEITGTDERQREKKLELLQQEYRLKVEEELDNHQIQILISLINFCSVQTPVLYRRFLLRAYGKEEELVLVKNLFSGKVEYPICSSCGTPLHIAGMCGLRAHITCNKCLSHCQECDQDVCSSCGIHACEYCQIEVCQDCRRICNECGKWFCNQHVLGCRLCKIEFCETCAETCQVCGWTVCGRHLIRCAVCEEKICSRCKTSCSHCEEEVCNTHLVACSFCGQLTCTHCIEVCETCKCQICTRHAYTCTLSKKRLCQRDSGRCQSCYTRVSKEFIRSCDIGGEKICILCAEICSQCQLPFCYDHGDELKSCDRCGEVYCLLCRDQRKTCPTCESLEYV